MKTPIKKLRAARPMIDNGVYLEQYEAAFHFGMTPVRQLTDDELHLLVDGVKEQIAETEFLKWKQNNPTATLSPAEEAVKKEELLDSKIRGRERLAAVDEGLLKGLVESKQSGKAKKPPLPDEEA